MQTRFFLHPPFTACPTGGNKFNRRILSRARRSRWSLQSVIIDPDASDDAPFDRLLHGRLASAAPAPLFVWDSLAMRRPPPSAPPGSRRSDTLLLHFLPSLDPGLNPVERAASRAREDDWIAHVSFLVATGRRLAELLKQRYPAVRTHVCEPGVDDIFRSVRRDRRLGSGGEVHLLSVGNLIAAKGYRELLAVVDLLQQRKWCWHIAGSHQVDPHFTREFLKRAEPWIAAGRIILHGPLCAKALAGLMSRMDLFISASHYESYGMALAEAVAAGLPVVATDVGEAERIIGASGRGRLVPAGAWESFAAAVQASIDALTDRSERTNTATAVNLRTWDEVFADFRTVCRVPMAAIGN